MKFEWPQDYNICTIFNWFTLQILGFFANSLVSFYKAVAKCFKHWILELHQRHLLAMSAGFYWRQSARSKFGRSH